MINFIDLSNNSSLEIFHATMESLLISDLDPFIYYSYSIAATTVVGYGPYSRLYILQTDEDGEGYSVGYKIFSTVIKVNLVLVLVQYKRKLTCSRFHLLLSLLVCHSIFDLLVRTITLT